MATYSSARKAPKNISELPRSRMKTSSTIAAPQTTSSGPNCFSGGSVTPPHPAGSYREQLALLGQVAGEKDDDRDLRQFGRLEVDRAERDAEVCAVDLRADPRQPRRQQQQDPGSGDHVPVALEHVVVAQEDDRRAEQHQSEDEDRRLVEGELVVDPVDEDEADRREQGTQREQVGVGIGQAQAQEDVRADAEREKVAAVDQAEVGDLVRAHDEHRREPGGDEQRHRDERQQLSVSGAHGLVSVPALSGGCVAAGVTLAAGAGAGLVVAAGAGLAVA